MHASTVSANKIPVNTPPALSAGADGNIISSSQCSSRLGDWIRPDPSNRTRERGAVRATVKDVARRAGVSPKTVSNVMNGVVPVSGSTRLRVEQAMLELDY